MLVDGPATILLQMLETPTGSREHGQPNPGWRGLPMAIGRGATPQQESQPAVPKNAGLFYVGSLRRIHTSSPLRREKQRSRVWWICHRHTASGNWKITVGRWRLAGAAVGLGAGERRLTRQTRVFRDVPRRGALRADRARTPSAGLLLEPLVVAPLPVPAVLNYPFRCLVAIP
jgi:hypothetical protein